MHLLISVFCTAVLAFKVGHSNPNYGVFDSYRQITDLQDPPKMCQDYSSEICAERWLAELDVIQKRNYNRLSNANYDYATDINSKNKDNLRKFQDQDAYFTKTLKQMSSKYQWQRFKSSRTRRLFKSLTDSIQSNNVTLTKRLLTISNNIVDIYNHGRPCFKECLKRGEADIVLRFVTERNYETLAGFWTSWRNVTGRRIRKLFVERMHLENIGAKENGYSDAASFKLANDFEEPNFNETVMKLYEEMLPLYKQLHGYVRHCLAKFYPMKFDKTGPIPAHILGNVWAQEWNNILPIIKQCQGNKSIVYIQEEANRNLQHASVKEMFEMAENFYKSIGTFPMTSDFWQRSVLTESPGKLMDCHGEASDFSNGVDYRIKMCTRKNLDDFTTIHHEMGHVQYFMAYRNQPQIFESSANTGFHEAIGDTIALSVKTPEHLKKIGLISKVPTSSSFDINYLMETALEKIVFLPFALTMDSYIWSIYNGSVPLDRLNEHWWKLRHRFQGLQPPNKRTENDFDPAAKYHIAFGISYIRYFMSFIYQFQFYESMCQLSGHTGPLHRCDFFGSKRAGRRLLKMLSKGQSQHWRDTLKILTGSRSVKSASLLRFFEPLHKWLKETNERLNIPIGW